MKELGVQNLAKSCHELLILATLARGDKHGYQLAVEIEERSQGFFRFNHGTLYPILHKLEHEKLIKGAWAADSPKRKRKSYQLTAKGRREAAGRLAQWETFFDRFFGIAREVTS